MNFLHAKQSIEQYNSGAGTLTGQKAFWTCAPQKKTH